MTEIGLNDYFDARAKGPFFLTSQRAALKNLGVTICDRTFVPSDKLFRLIARERIGQNYIVRPIIATPSLLIPFDAMEHDEHYIDGRNIANVVETSVNEHLDSKKIIISGDTTEFMLLEIKKFSYDILGSILSSHANTPIILTDYYFEIAFCFEYDLCVNFVAGFEDSNGNIAGLSRKFWNDYFSREFRPEIPDNQYHVDLINKYYVQNSAGASNIVL